VELVEWDDLIHLTLSGYEAITKVVVECKEDHTNKRK
jgi:hypothetical protein